MRTLYLDTETTGLDGNRDRIVEIAIIGDDGEVLIDSLINPNISIQHEASAIHGIYDSMVRGAPTLRVLWPQIETMVRNNRVVIYNAKFDLKFLPSGFASASEIQCAMLAYAARRGERTPKLKKYRWHKLSDAAAHVGHQWSSAAHRARSDAEACRSVWRWTNGQPLGTVNPRRPQLNGGDTHRNWGAPPPVQDNYRRESITSGGPNRHVSSHSASTKEAPIPKPGYRWKFNSVGYEQEPIPDSEGAAARRRAAKEAPTPKPGYRWKFNSVGYEQEPIPELPMAGAIFRCRRAAACTVRG